MRNAAAKTPRAPRKTECPTGNPKLKMSRPGGAFPVLHFALHVLQFAFLSPAFLGVLGVLAAPSFFL
jgi:hypothetical protein